MACWLSEDEQAEKNSKRTRSMEAFVKCSIELCSYIVLRVMLGLKKLSGVSSLITKNDTLSLDNQKGFCTSLC